MEKFVRLQMWAFAVLGIGMVLGFAVGRAAAAVPQFKLEDPQSGYPTEEMGRSIAVDGNTMQAKLSIFRIE